MAFHTICLMFFLIFNVENTSRGESKEMHGVSFRIHSKYNRKNDLDKFKMKRRETLVVTPPFEHNARRFDDNIYERAGDAEVDNGEDYTHDPHTHMKRNLVEAVRNQDYIDVSDEVSDTKNPNNVTTDTQNDEEFNSKEAIMDVIAKQNIMVEKLVKLYETELGNKQFDQLIDSINKKRYMQFLREKSEKQGRSGNGGLNRCVLRDKTERERDGKKKDESKNDGKKSIKNRDDSKKEDKNKDPEEKGDKNNKNEKKNDINKKDEKKAVEKKNIGKKNDEIKKDAKKDDEKKKDDKKDDESKKDNKKSNVQKKDDKKDDENKKSYKKDDDIKKDKKTNDTDTHVDKKDDEHKNVTEKEDDKPPVFIKIDETLIKKRLASDPFVRRILNMARKKKEQYFRRRQQEIELNRG